MQLNILEFQEFVGNSDQATAATRTLSGSLKARFIKFNPTAYSGWPTVRLELYKGK